MPQEQEPQRIYYEGSKPYTLINEQALMRAPPSTIWEGGPVTGKIRPQDAHCVLNRTRKSIKSTVHILPTKNQGLLVLWKDWVVSLDEKCLLPGLKILMPPRVLPYRHTASVLKEIMVRGSWSYRKVKAMQCLILQGIILLKRSYVSLEGADKIFFFFKYIGNKLKEILLGHFHLEHKWEKKVANKNITHVPVSYKN